MRLEQLNEFYPRLPYETFDLLFRWAEWRDAADCPRSAMPTPTYRWFYRGGELVAEPGLCLARATSQSEPTRMMEFSRAFGGLSYGHRAMLIALVQRQDKAFPRGQEWMQFLTRAGLTSRQYKILLGDALLSFAKMAAARGLMAA